ncbi:hypothetical protein ACFVWY_27900 [Streptomyces sp. NPDC058195]|uniref:hypothetical protein n=1 Tax=Streptomyces sp. NPDC058195 TaxID=3346375 RepID=UPI0036EB17C1
MRRLRCRAAAVALGAVAGAALLAGCGDDGGLRSAGTVPAAIGPVRLWPGLPVASAAPKDYGEGETARIPGIVVPDDDVRRLDPVAVVRAGLAARPARSSGTAALPADTVRRINACGSEPASCPVLRPYYRDLTGDGKDDLVLGIRLTGGQLSVRAYTARQGALTRVLSTSDAVISVELAGRDLIVRAPSAIPGYEYRTSWTWDGGQRAMLPAREEIQRMPSPPAPVPRPTPAASTPAPLAESPAGRR